MTDNGRAIADFSSELDAEWVEIQGGIRDAVIYITNEALAKVTEKSPVDTGHFQNNWLVSIGQPDESTTESIGTFAAKSAGAIAAYASVTGFPVIYLQNNLPYALRIENGWSSQAPAGVVAMTVAELEVEWSRMSQ
jgi:hypothetical protein